jgi:hypothetical protein
MKRFQPGDRVKVTVPNGLEDQTGTVKRLRKSDNGAWIKMDSDPPPDLEIFPADDHRHRHMLLYPGECEPIEAPSATPTTPSD